MKTSNFERVRTISVAAIISLTALIAFVPYQSPALTITDPFTNSANWGTPFTEPGKNMVVASGRMNFTSSTTGGGGAGLTRNTPFLTTTQNWSVKVDVHVDPFTILTEEHGVSVFLGVGKTSDYLGTHVLLGFDRDWWDPTFYGVNDDVQTNGVSAPGLFNVNFLTSSNATLRLDYTATNQTLTYYCDTDGPTGNSGWSLLGAINIASGTYNLHLSPSDTLSVLLAGWSQEQVVTSGQAYLDNLEISMEPDFAPNSIAGYSVIGTITNVNGVNIPPTPGTNVYGVTTFSQIGPDSNNTYSGTYTYTKTGADSGTIIIHKTAPPDQAGEMTTNLLFFTSSTNGAFAHYYDFVDTPPTVQYGTFQVIQTNGLTGSLQVTITPSGAVSAGAQWQVDGGAWQNSGSVVGGLSLGAHTVAYKTIPGWSAPCSHEIIIAANTTNTTNSAYATVEFSFTTNIVGVTITGYIGSGVVLNIPSAINCQPVTSIAAGAFGVFPPGSPIASVTIPHSVTTVGDQAFQGCNNLTNVLIGSNVTHIGNAAFDCCYNLRQVTIPNSVLSIGDYAFFNCSSLTNLNVGSGLMSIGVGSFGYTPIRYVSLPSSLKTIGTSAFRDLTNITLGSSVTNLGDFAFADCSALRNIVIPGSISVIGNGAFQGCGTLTNVTLSHGLAQIGTQAFQYCVNLATITIPASVAGIGDAAFEFCPSLTGIYFRGNAPTLGGSLVFHVADNLIVYLLPGTTGWSATYGGRPTALWQPRLISGGLSFGMQTNQFGFDIIWASGRAVVTEATTNLTSPAWLPLKTNTLVTDSVYFSDAQWTNHPRRYYRVRSP